MSPSDVTWVYILPFNCVRFKTGEGRCVTHSYTILRQYLLGVILEIMSLEIIFSCSEALSGHQGNTWEFSQYNPFIHPFILSTTISLSLYLYFIFT